MAENGIRVIKVITQKPSLDFMEDRAVSDFQAFGVTAAVHVKRVQSDYAINQMLDVLERLHGELKSALQSTQNRVA